MPDLEFVNATKPNELKTQIAEAVEKKVVPLAQAAGVQFVKNVAYDLLDFLLEVYRQGSGGEDAMIRKLGMWAEAHEKNATQIAREYPKHIEVKQNLDGTFTIKPDSPEWAEVAAALEFGTRILPPVPHWNAARTSYVLRNRKTLESIFKQALQDAQKKSGK